MVQEIYILYDTYITTLEYVCMVTKTWYLDGDWVKGRDVRSWYRIDGWQFVPRYHYWNHVCLPHVNWPNGRDELSRGNLIWLRCEGWLPSARSSSHYAMLSVLTDHITSPLVTMLSVLTDHITGPLVPAASWNSPLVPPTSYKSFIGDDSPGCRLYDAGILRYRTLV